MKLICFKRFKLAGIVICMLAAGICYSCSNPIPYGAQREPVMELACKDPQREEGSGGRDGVEQKPEAPGVQEPTDREGPGEESKGAEGVDSSDRVMVQSIFVHVCGQVQEPGVYELPAGSRVHEAVAAAGGFSETADREYLNLAQEVEDGMKLEVPTREQAEAWEHQQMMGGSSVSISEGFPSGDGVKVNINTAAAEELMRLKGIGRSRAEDIIQYRARMGGFKSTREIMKVPGIKEAAFEKIKDRITV